MQLGGVPQMTLARRRGCCGGESRSGKRRAGMRLCEYNEGRQKAQAATSYPQKDVISREQKHPQTWAKYKGYCPYHTISAEVQASLMRGRQVRDVGTGDRHANHFAKREKCGCEHQQRYCALKRVRSEACANQDEAEGHRAAGRVFFGECGQRQFT